MREYKIETQLVPIYSESPYAVIPARFLKEGTELYYDAIQDSCKPAEFRGKRLYGKLLECLDLPLAAKKGIALEFSVKFSGHACDGLGKYSSCWYCSPEAVYEIVSAITAISR